jgi:hypothetical protein
MWNPFKNSLGLAPQTTVSPLRDPSEVAKAIEKRLEYTPDNWYLSSREHHWTFIYDGMKERMPHHNLLGEPVLPGIRAFTKHKFSLFKNRLGASSYPIPLEKEYKNTVPYLPVQGELHLLNKDVIKGLDILRRNGYFFARKRVMIYVPYFPKLSRSITGPMEVQAVKAWMYIGTQGWNDMLNGMEYGVVKTFYNDKNVYFPRYYNFTNAEYEED